MEDEGIKTKESKDISVPGSHFLQDFAKSNIQSSTINNAGTFRSEIEKYGAEILYDQYTLLNEDGRLVKGGQMSYTNLMQQIIQSPRVSSQANEASILNKKYISLQTEKRKVNSLIPTIKMQERLESYTNMLQTPVAFDNSMILTTSRFSPQEPHQHDRLYEQ